MGFPEQDQSRPLKRLSVLTALAALVLSACTAGRGGTVPYDPPNFVAPDAEPALTASGPQRIGPLDKLRISVFQVADLTGEFQVDTSGNIDFPLIGTVEAQGRTSAELAEHIGQRLSERYLRGPSVQVAITEAFEHTITVDGAVRQAGVRPIRGTTTLMRAVAMAGGTTQEANPSRVVVFRTINGERMAAAFDLRAIRRAQAEDPTIYGNDIVVVDGDSSRSLFRDILSAIPVVGMFRPY